MKIRLAAPLQNDSVVDGFGVRTVIWTQGCAHNCPFCHNPGTHDFNGGKEFTLDEIYEELDNLPKQDGITLSGGDPLYQIDAVTEIAKYAKKKGLNIWCYTGFTFEEIIKMSEEKPIYREFLDKIDVLVDGRFKIEERDLNLLFRGSRNQRLIDVKKSLDANKVVLLNEYEYNETKYFERIPMYV